MANWLKPLITDLYTQVLDWLKDRDTDLAKGLDPAAVTVENPQPGFIRYSSANRRWEKFDGTSWGPLATSYAINADTASKWGTPRTLTLSGGATGSASIDGSGNVTLAAAITQGAGSGLNADLLDGQQGAWYADIAARLGFTPVQQGTGVGRGAGGGRFLSLFQVGPDGAALGGDRGVGQFDVALAAAQVDLELVHVGGAGAGGGGRDGEAAECEWEC